MTPATRMGSQSSWTLGPWLLGILVSLVLGRMPGCAASALGVTPGDVPGQLTLQDGKLTARIGGASLRQVMEEVSRLSGAQVRWMDSKVREQAVSVEFHDLALAEAVRRILSARNFLLVYAPYVEGTRITQIWIASREGGSGPPERHRPPAPPVLPPTTAEEPAATMEQSMAGAEAPLEALIQTATDEADLAARLSAIGELGNHALDDARVMDLLTDLADHDSNPQVRDAASMLLGGGR